MENFTTPARAWLKFVAGALLTGVLAAGPALAGKKDDTIRFAYDQAPERLIPSSTMCASA